MRKFYYLVLITLLGWSCQKDQEQLTPIDPVPEAVVDTKEQIPIEKIFYHKATEQYIYQKGDPYSFENMKRAYEQLKAKRQEQFGTRAGTGGSIELTPSHYSLKIYPRNESEQWRVERMRDVMVAYLPFDYAPLPEEEAEVMSLTRSMVEPFEEEVRYTVTYDNLQSVEGPQPPVTLNMPVLYVTWPATKPLPLDLDYEIVDQLLLPTGWDDRIPVPGFDSLPTSQLQAREITLRGRILDWDKTLQEYVPIPGLKMCAGYGSRRCVCYTDDDGIFTFDIDVITLSQGTFYWEYACDMWKIVKNNTSSGFPFQSSSRKLSSCWDESDTTRIVDLYKTTQLYTKHNAITRAMYYFYNKDHYISTFGKYDDGIRIITDIDGPYAGLFTYSSSTPAFITIFNTVDAYNTPDLISVVLHEIGHLCNYRGAGYSRFTNTHKLLKESYASYVSSYITEELYNNLGYVPPVSGYPPLCYNSWQNWDKFETITTDEIYGYYSPLYVDLFDNLNQSLYYENAPNDIICGFSHGIVNQIMTISTNWSSCRYYLQQQIGTYYTADEFADYIDDYDYWFQHN